MLNRADLLNLRAANSFDNSTKVLVRFKNSTWCWFTPNQEEEEEEFPKRKSCMKARIYMI